MTEAYLGRDGTAAEGSQGWAEDRSIRASLERIEGKIDALTTLVAEAIAATNTTKETRP